MGIKTFVAIYLSIIIAVSTFVIFALPKLQTQNETITSNHFSVRWMGYVPAYSALYPEYYVCINNLASDQLTMPIALQIKNQEAIGLYFKMEPYGVPPSGWTLAPYTIGLISKDATLQFTYTSIRTRPSSIPEGRITETISLVVKAYYDSLYTEFYSQDNFTVTFNFLDKTASVWTTLYACTFDDGTTQGWSGVSVSTDYYRSFQYSIRWNTNGMASKSFDISGVWTEAYLIFAARSAGWSSPSITLNGVKYFEPDVTPSANTWYQFAIKLPTGQVTTVGITPWPGINAGYAYLDDAFVIAK